MMPGDRPAPADGEIEITPEMIEAGAEVILEAYGGLDLFSPPTDVAARVFRAMSRLDASIPGPRHAQTQP
jgi:hypothetical protein